MNHDNRPIGIFDSGLGGLTVVAAVKQLLPNENIIYLGDTARVPYGNKSVENITKFGINNSTFLINKNVKMIVVACNSVSAVAIDTLSKQFPKTPILGVIEAGVAACLHHTPQTITVTGTRATINSGVYKAKLTAEHPDIKINSVPCPLFVPIAEEGITDHEITRNIIDLYLSELRDCDEVQLLLLGCTHYPLLKNAIKQYIHNNTVIIDSASACAQYTSQFLTKNNLHASPADTATTSFFVTDKPAEFQTQSSRFFGHKINNIEVIDI